MSTRSTIARRDNVWHLYEDYTDDGVVLRITNSTTAIRIDGSTSSVSITLPADVLDAIAAAHSQRLFPHQRTDAGFAIPNPRSIR